MPVSTLLPNNVPSNQGHHNSCSASGNTLYYYLPKAEETSLKEVKEQIEQNTQERLAEGTKIIIKNKSSKNSKNKFGYQVIPLED